MTENFSEFEDIWVFAEQKDGKLKPVVAELLGKGRELADKLDQELGAILIGENVEELSNELAQFGASTIYLVEGQHYSTYHTKPYTKVITKLISKYKPEILLYGATHVGRDLAPSVAGELSLGLTADCTDLSITEYLGKKLLLQIRPAFGGNIMAEIVCPESRPQMATVRPNVFEEPKPKKSGNYEVVREEIEISPEMIAMEILEHISEGKKGEKSIEEADLVISGGRGVGSEEGFKILEQLAKELKGVVGCSRPIVEKGWMPKSKQVGQSGKTISPNLYLACGISGAIQHKVGIRGADRIIAINEDPEAPIFEIADLGIVGDLHEIIPLLTEHLKQEKKT